MEILLNFKNKIIIILIILVSTQAVNADSHNIYEVLEIIKKDLKTLEKAVYSNGLSDESNEENNFTELDQNSEEVLTRHLLKLSEVEKQFQELTNKFEEINFKIDKLSSRLSKVQADNQLRFQQLEDKTISSDLVNLQSEGTSMQEDEKILPGSSEPQDLGSISYKDSEPKLDNQQTQSVETTASVITENFVIEEKILPDVGTEDQYEFAPTY
jgi:hypothetical protein